VVLARLPLRRGDAVLECLADALKLSSRPHQPVGRRDRELRVGRRDAAERPPKPPRDRRRTGLGRHAEIGFVKGAARPQERGYGIDRFGVVQPFRQRAADRRHDGVHPGEGPVVVDPVIVEPRFAIEQRLAVRAARHLAQPLIVAAPAHGVARPVERAEETDWTTREGGAEEFARVAVVDRGCDLRVGQRRTGGEVQEGAHRVHRLPRRHDQTGDQGRPRADQGCDARGEDAENEEERRPLLWSFVLFADHASLIVGNGILARKSGSRSGDVGPRWTGPWMQPLEAGCIALIRRKRSSRVRRELCRW
jgi:hypothetical protein